MACFILTAHLMLIAESCSGICQQFSTKHLPELTGLPQGKAGCEESSVTSIKPCRVGLGQGCSLVAVEKGSVWFSGL